MAEAPSPAEQRRIMDEYACWKKHTPLLYDLVITHSLEWPSLTVQWLPGKALERDKPFGTQRLLLGTHTSEKEANFLVVADTVLPVPAADHGLLATGLSGRWARVTPRQRVLHDGEINRARAMPQNPNIVATKTVSSQVYVFDIARHPSQPADPTAAGCSPTIRLQGHRKEGYGLAFNARQEGLLASGSDDGLVCVWDIAAPLRDGRRELPPLSTCSGHTNVVEDVAWNAVAPTVLASVSDDCTLKVWDMRDCTRPQSSIVAHPREVNAVQFNPFSQHILATGSADQTAAIWDTRNFKCALHHLVGHQGDLFSVQWAPFRDTILATSGADRRICLWDLSRIGQSLSPEDAKDGPPELLFIHAGHTARVSDLAWNAHPDDEWVIASVAEDNILQIWRICEALTEPDPKAEDEG